MPTVLRSGPYRFLFYSADGVEPPHVHVVRDENRAKFWLDPVRLHSSGGFTRLEIGRLERIIKVNVSDLLRSWNEFFSG
jgi:hypothetical protein